MIAGAALRAAPPTEFTRRRIGSRTATAVVVLTSGLVAAVLSALSLRDGIHMTPDSWAYWQGSVSLIEGRGYRYFFGSVPITHWPPLYPLYLAGVQAVAGVSGSALIATNVILVATATMGWLLAWWVPLRRFRDQLDRLELGAALLLAVYIAAFTAHHFNALHAEGLRYAVLPFFLLAIWRSCVEPDLVPFARWTAVASLVGVVLMLTHNASIAYVAAGSVVLATLARRPLASRLGASAALVLLPLAAWMATRAALGQLGSHAFGLSVAEESPGTYAWQLLSGTAYLIGPERFRLSLALLAGAALFLVAALGPARTTLRVADARQSRLLRTYLLFGVAAAVFTWAQFSTTWIDEPLSGRFLLFLPLLMVPALMVLVTRLRRPWLALALCVGFTAQPIVRLIERSGRPIDAYPYMAFPQDSIDPSFVGRLPVTAEGRRMISPPLYPWTELVIRGVDQRDDSQPRGLKGVR